jgi:hypothetical protein
MIRSYAHVRTARADQYLLQLSSGSQSDDSIPQYRTVILFPVGKCELVASTAYLDIAITAHSVSEAALIEDAISERLDNLALNEELHYQWIVSPEEIKRSAPGGRVASAE